MNNIMPHICIHFIFVDTASKTYSFIKNTIYRFILKI